MIASNLAEDHRRRRAQLAAERAECEALEVRFGSILDRLTVRELESLLLGVYGRGADMQGEQIARRGLTLWCDRLPLLQLLEAKSENATSPKVPRQNG